MAYLCSIDLGTSSVKTAIFDESGMLIGSVSENYKVIVPQIGFAEQEPETWWMSVCNTVRALLAEYKISPKEIAGVGLSGQMHGMVALNKEKNCIRNAVIHLDQRSNKEAEELIRRFGKDRLEKYMSNCPSAGFMLMSLLWMKKYEPSSYEHISCVLSPKDYIRYRLTGGIGTETTDAAGTYAFNVKDEKWADELLEECGIDKRIFPNCSRPYEAAGTVTKKAEMECGLRCGTIVCYGGADQAMQYLGNGILDSHAVTSTIGTGGQILYTTNEPVSLCKQSVNLFNGVRPGSWYLLGATLSAGLSLNWFMNNIKECTEYPDLDMYSDKMPVCADDLFFLPYLAGVRTPYNNSSAKAVFTGLTLKHDKIDMVRAIMEGVVFSLKECLDHIHSVMPEADTVIASGGATKARLWLQLQADIYNKPILVNRGDSQANLGGAVVAGVGAGIYKDLNEAVEHMIHIKKEVVYPSLNNVKIFQEKYEKYKLIYPSFLSLN